MGKNYTYVPGAEFPYQYKYEHMAVTTDCVIFTYEDWKLKVLLVRRGGEPYKGQWAFPGGFLKMDENAEQGALRELREETGLEPSAIGQLGVFSDVERDPRERVITIAWYALVKPSDVVGGDDADEAAWFPVDNLPPLAFDHRKIFDEAMERLRRDIHFQTSSVCTKRFSASSSTGGTSSGSSSRRASWRKPIPGRSAMNAMYFRTNFIWTRCPSLFRALLQRRPISASPAPGKAARAAPASSSASTGRSTTR